MLHYIAIVLSLLIIVLTYGDVWTTLKALTLPGNREANPVMRFFMAALGGKWIIVRFLFSFGIIWNALQKGALAHQGLIDLTLAANVLLLCYVVYNNLKVAKLINA